MDTKISSIHVCNLNVPLTEPFGISGGAQVCANNLLVTVRLNDASIGYGEAAPLPPYNGETQQMAREAIELAIPSLINTDVRDWRHISDYLKKELHHSGSARCALEIAILDALSRHNSSPLHTIFGDKASSVGSIETDMTITTNSNHSFEESIEHAISSTKEIQNRGIRVIKTKVGLGIDRDVARLKVIRSQAPNSPLILDGNGGFSADEALRLIEELKKFNIIPLLFEQPVPGNDLDGLKKVSDQSGVLVAADESVKDLSTAKNLIDMKCAPVVNIKIMKAGLVEAFDIAKLCHDSGIELMIGGNVETILAMTSSAHLSFGTGLFRFHDLDTPAWMVENPFIGGFRQQGGMLTIQHITSGTGISLR
jgi:L-alanine-DL-glutamate epimerase-like enolase superfamily enzyme